MLMETRGVLSLNEVNVSPSESFEWFFADAVEYFPEAIQYVMTKRPFTSVHKLKKAFDDYLEHLDSAEKESIIQRYPDLLDILAEEDKLLADSQNEQDYLNMLTAYGKTTLTNNNSLYKTKFGFSFIICVKENRIKNILEKIKIRQKNTKEEEIKMAIEELKKICRLKIDELIWPDY